MSTVTFLVVMLVWSVAGFIAAIAFGKAIRGVNGQSDQDVFTPISGAIKVFPKKKRKVQSREVESSAA